MSLFRLDGIYVLVLGSMISAILLLVASIGLELTTLAYLLLGLMSSTTVLWGGLSLHLGLERGTELADFLVRMTL